MEGTLEELAIRSITSELSGFKVNLKFSSSSRSFSHTVSPVLNIALFNLDLKLENVGSLKRRKVRL